jgi:PAS domain S-box-containing protein
MTAARQSRFTFAENEWRILLLSASVIILLFTVYCLSQGITIIFMHLYYFPIILFAYHYHKKGVILSAMLGLLYVALVTFFAFSDVEVIAGALVRFIVFIGIAAVVSFLSETLEKRELERNTIIANSEDGIIIVDLTRQIITEVNRRGSDMLGYVEEELVNSTLDTIWHDKQEQVRFSEIISTGGFARNFDAHFIQKTGGTRSVLISAGTLPKNRIVLTATDITDRESMLTDMRRLSEVRESIISNANVWLMVLDSRGRILEWNRAAEEMSGYPVTEVIGGNAVWKNIYPEKNYRKEITEKITGIIKQDNYLENLQTTIVAKNGTKKTLLWNTRGLPDRKGIIGNYIAIGVDITDRASAEQVSKEYAEWYSTLLRTTVDGYNLVDATGRLLEVNDNYCRMTGFSREELLGRSISDQDVNESKDIAFSHMQKILKTGSDRFETRHRRKNGEAIDVEISVVLQAQKRHFIVFVRDITERKRAEKALLESEEKFRAFFTTSQDSVFITTTDGRWVDLNDAAVQLFGYDSREELLQVNIRDLYADPAERDAHISYIREQGYSLEYPVNLRKKDGTIINTLITSVARKDSNGNTIGFQGSVRDVTEKKIAQDRIEELLRIINTSPAVAFLWRAEENWPVEMVSRNISQFGYTVDDFMSGRVLFSSIIHPDDLGRIGAEVAYNSAHNIEEFTQVYQILGKDRTEYWIEDYTHIRRDKTGKITHFEGIVIDITERKRAEEALRESEHRQAMLLDAVPDMMFVISQNGVYRDFSVPDNTVLAVSADKIIGTNIRDSGFNKESADTIMNYIGVTLDTKKLQQFEYDLFMPDGEHRYEARMVALNENEVLGIVRDITARKQAEEEIKRSIERFRTVMDSIDAFVYVADMKTYELLFINKYGKDIWGEIEGKVCWQTIQSGQNGPCPFCTNDHLVDDNGKPTGIYNWEFKNTVNGHWYDCRDSAIRWLDGRFVRLEIATDITERKQIEEALRESEQKFRDLFENSRDGIVITDTRTKQFVDSNEMFSHMIGYRPEEVKNLGLVDIHPESGRSHAFEVFEKMARHEINVAENLQVRRKDGTIFYADISAYPINKSNKDYLVGVFRDITERKQAEELKRHFTEELEQQVRSRTQELEDSLNEKVVLLREVHHRVRNNFQIIISLLSLQSRSIGDEKFSRAMRESQNRIRAMAFVHDTLYTSADFARIDLEPYVKYLTTQLFTFFKVRPGTISLILDVKNIFIDINMAIPLGLVINELVSNSLKHAFPEGRKGQITISIHDVQKGLTLTYQDNGIGFSEGFDWQTTESLGFKLIRVLIDQLDGTIEQEPAKGTLFTIRVMRKTDVQGDIYGTFNRVPE